VDRFHRSKCSIKIIKNDSRLWLTIIRVINLKLILQLCVKRSAIILNSKPSVKLIQLKKLLITVSRINEK